jgi:hypothetical protein
MVMRKHLGAAALLALSACVSTGGSSQPQIVHICPIAPTYTATFQKQAAQQLADLPPDSPLARMVVDYLAVRKEIKDCK